MANTVRPTKKQRELLTFIERFIGEHGYSPSYREIMTGLNYTSVATVALHINNLIKRGHLRKRDHSARSLEVVAVTDTDQAPDAPKAANEPIKPSEEKWLIDKIEHLFQEAEGLSDLTGEHIDQLQLLVGSLKVLSLEAASLGFAARLAVLKQKLPV